MYELWIKDSNKALKGPMGTTVWLRIPMVMRENHALYETFCHSKHDLCHYGALGGSIEFLNGIVPKRMLREGLTGLTSPVRKVFD